MDRLRFLLLQPLTNQCLIRLGLLILSGVVIRAACADDRDQFCTGTELKVRLSQPTSWSSDQVPLQNQLLQLQSQASVAIVLDRRIDPDHPVTVQTGFVPRSQVLQKLSEAVPGVDWHSTDLLVYAGPSAAAARLPVLLDHGRDIAAQLRGRLSSADFRRLSVPQPAQWEILSEPREILQVAARRASLAIANPEEIPHDVWDAAAWPPMPFFELATIVLNQFDLMLSVARTDATLTVVAIDPAMQLERTYKFDRTRRDQVTAACRQQFPEIELKWTGSAARTTGSLSQHVWLQELWEHSENADETTTTPLQASLRTRHFTLTAERVSLGQLIQYFRDNAVNIDLPDADTPRVQRILKAEINLDLKSVPGDEFFSQVFGQHFQTVTVQDTRVVLTAKP